MNDILHHGHLHFDYEHYKCTNVRSKPIPRESTVQSEMLVKNLLGELTNVFETVKLKPVRLGSDRIKHVDVKVKSAK